MSSAIRVELVFDADCPNVESARTMLRAALRLVGQQAAWTEWDRADVNTPETFRVFGSPTVLVNGIDVASGDDGSIAVEGKACRLYVDGDGCICGAPALPIVVAAIQRAADLPRRTSAAS